MKLIKNNNIADYRFIDTLQIRSCNQGLVRLLPLAMAIKLINDVNFNLKGNKEAYLKGFNEGKKEGFKLGYQIAIQAMRSKLTTLEERTDRE